MMNKALKALRIVAVVLILSSIVFVMLAGLDVSPPEFPDLAVDRPDAPPERNAYTYFAAATNSLVIPAEPSFLADYLGGVSDDHAAAAEIVSQNKEAADLILQGVQCRICLAPEVAALDALIPYGTPWMILGRILALAIHLDRLAGRHAEAADMCIALLRFGDLIQADAEGLVPYMVGLNALDAGLRQAQDLVLDDATPPDALSRISECLPDLGPFAPGLARALKVEFRIMANEVEQLAAGKVPEGELFTRISGYFFQPNRTVLTLGNLYRDMIRDAPLLHAEINPADLDELAGMKTDGIGRVLLPNAVGRIMCSIMFIDFGSMHARKCQTECGIAATRLLIACRSYRAREGKLPDDLQALVPDYLSAVPVDPFDGKPFRYSSSKGIVYSVGRNLQDFGGSARVPAEHMNEKPSQRRWRAEDAVFEIDARPQPAPPPQASGDR